VELSTGAYGWAALFGAAGLYLLYEFFVVYDPANFRDREDRR
jgi:hypothetical protein